jgi:hypothetical protein
MLQKGEENDDFQIIRRVIRSGAMSTSTIHYLATMSMNPR